MRSLNLFTVALISHACGPTQPPPDPIECDPILSFSAVTELSEVYSPRGEGTPILMDRTEVTQGQYNLFLEATNDGQNVGVQPDECSWNSSFKPPSECYEGSRTPEERMLCDVQPQTCVDFCDARAYCEWAGKRLCGGIRGQSITDFESTSLQSEWHVACTSGGQYPFSSGSEEDAQSCNTQDCVTEMTCPYSPGLARLLPPGNMPDCQSPSENYDGVFDLTGNVAEWEDACDTAGNCAIRGGTTGVGGTGARCDQVPLRPRQDRSTVLGFRCCDDPI